MKIIELTSDDFLGQKLLKYNKDEITIILFYTDWCGFCKKFKPMYEELNNYSKDYNFCLKKVNADNEKKLIENYNKFLFGCKIDSYPTILFYKNGFCVKKFDNERSIENLLNVIKSL